MEFLLNKLNCTPKRQEPRIWISRLVIYQQIEPTLEIIRDIRFNRGLNIVCADEATDETYNGIISGHSAGKTTLCRFIRYLLGEKNYATEKATKLIKETLQNAWVTGEIHILGQQFAVMRPLHATTLSSFKKNATVEDLINSKTEKVSHSAYHQGLEFSKTLNNMLCKSVVPSGEPIYWGHVLSWCARDQESRLSNLYEWRTSASNSDSPTFSNPRISSLFTIRALLDLLHSDEIESSKKLGRLENELKQKTSAIEKERLEPIVCTDIYERKLRQELFRQDSSLAIDGLVYESDIITDETLRKTALFACQTLEKLYDDHNVSIASMDKAISELNNELNEKSNALQPLELENIIFEKELSELNSDIQQKDENKKKLDEILNSKCKRADILIKDCYHIQNKQKEISKFLDGKDQLEQAKMINIKINQNMEIINPIKDEKAEINCKIRYWESQKKVINGKNNNLIINKDRILRLVEDIDNFRKELVNPPKNTVLEKLVTEAKEIEGKISEEKSRIKNIQGNFENNSKLLSQIFSNILSRLLPSDSSCGKVILDKGNIAFNIIQGQELGGEAINTLSILLADLSCLIYNTVNEKSNLPDFLLHDSPREADMGIGLYSKYLRLAASLQSEYGENCPFQYIVTTTTPPPDDLKKFIVLKISASPEAEMLLRQQLKHDQQTFDFTG